MAQLPKLWIRHEVRPTERRAPVVPSDARRLVQRGLAVTVEESPQRAFPIERYADAGCAIAPPGSWVQAPPDAYIVGLKELPDKPATLTHRHVFFGHAFKGQACAGDLLTRFVKGGGELLDIEYLTGSGGRRLAAFGHWAGYVGAALAVLTFRGRLEKPLQPLSKEELDAALQPRQTPSDGRTATSRHPRALVIGALGRCGRGARAALAVAGIAPTCWDLEETKFLDRRALLDHDILVNAVLTTGPAQPFLTPTDLDDPARRLTIVSDVTCDNTSDWNVLPIYQHTTSWERPVERLHNDPPLEIIAIDNLPSLLPEEASVAFSAELTPQLMTLGTADPAWQRSAAEFRAALERLALLDPAQ
jgi:saccharopine dehydrogenase (NAD+, L-lysine forming)